MSSEFKTLINPIVGMAQDIKGLGITKREQFAAMFMAAMLTQESNQNRSYELAYSAIANADALIEILNNGQV
jgi:hypothetical protein